MSEPNCPANPQYTLVIKRFFSVMSRGLTQTEIITLPFPPYVGLVIEQDATLSPLRYFEINGLNYDRDKGHFVCSVKCPEHNKIDWSNRRMAEPEALGVLAHGPIDGCSTLEELREKFPECIEPYPDGRVTKPVKL